MNSKIILNDKTNKKVKDQLKEFPDFGLVCRLNEILDERGLTKSELALLTGIRIAVISELSNMKRTTISVPHILVIAKALRLTNISELFSFSMSGETLEEFERDREEIEIRGLLESQEDELFKLKRKG